MWNLTPSSPPQSQSRFHARAKTWETRRHRIEHVKWKSIIVKWHVRESYINNSKRGKNRKAEVKPIMRVREKVIEWEMADDIEPSLPLDSSTWKMYVSCVGVRTGKREKSVVQPVLWFSASRPSRPSLSDRLTDRSARILLRYCRLFLLSARLEQDETGEGDRVSKHLDGSDG